MCVILNQNMSEHLIQKNTFCTIGMSVQLSLSMDGLGQALKYCSVSLDIFSALSSAANNYGVEVQISSVRSCVAKLGYFRKIFVTYFLTIVQGLLGYFKTALFK